MPRMRVLGDRTVLILIIPIIGIKRPIDSYLSGDALGGQLKPRLTCQLNFRSALVIASTERIIAMLR